MKTVSSKYIIQRAIDDIGNDAEEMYKKSKDRLANWIYDAMRILGNFVMLENKQQNYIIDNYIALLPCDYIQEIVVLDKDGNPIQHHNQPFNDTYISNPPVLRYRNDGSRLIFNTQNTVVSLLYKGVSFDDEGYVLIADDEFDSQTRAIVAYIAMMISKIKARSGNQVSMQMYQLDMQEWHRLAGNAGAHRYMPKTQAEWYKVGQTNRALLLHYDDYLDKFSHKDNLNEKYL